LTSNDKMCDAFGVHGLGDDDEDCAATARGYQRMITNQVRFRAVSANR